MKEPDSYECAAQLIVEAGSPQEAADKYAKEMLIPSGHSIEIDVKPYVQDGKYVQLPEIKYMHVEKSNRWQRICYLLKEILKVIYGK